MTAHAAISGDTIERTVLAVPDAHCAGCMAKIERGLGAVPGIVSARLNLSTRQVAIAHGRALQVPDLVAAITRLGFAAQPVAETNI